MRQLRQFKHIFPAAILTSVFFVLDINTPLGLFSDWLLYIFPLLLLTWNTGDKTVIASTSLFSILLAAGFFLAPPGHNPLVFSFINRCVGIFVLWTIAFIMMKRKEVLDREKEARAAAEKEKNVLDAMMENVPDGIIIVDAPDGAIRRVSRYGYELAGRDEHYFTGVPLGSHPAAWNMHDADGVTLSDADGLPLACAMKDEIIKDREYVLVKDGEKVQILVNAGPIKDNSGKITGAVAAFRDMREYKRTQAALRENEDRLKLLFENSSDAILFLTIGGQVISANDAACRMFGYSCGELKSRRREDLFDSNDPRLKEYLKTRRETGRAEGDVNLIKKDGSTFEGAITSSTFMGSDGEECVGVVIRDISWRKELERQRDDFISMISHDLKSPLTAINGYAELVLSGRAGDISADAREMADAIFRNGTKLMDMVEGFLFASRIHAGKMTAELQPGDLAALLPQVVRDFLPQALKKKQELSLEAGLLPTVFFDRRLVDRAISNLVINSINYTQAGGRITLKAEEKERDGAAYAVVSVSDNGPGIPPEEVGRVFDRYYRSNRAGGRKGAGLGLSIVKIAAEMHGGWAEVESREGEGSDFRIFLPIKAALPARQEQ